MVSNGEGRAIRFSTGRLIRIRRSYRLPYAGQCGTIVGIDERDDKGPFLVRFNDGTEFRYRAKEIDPNPRSINFGTTP